MKIFSGRNYQSLTDEICNHLNYEFDLDVQKGNLQIDTQLDILFNIQLNAQINKQLDMQLDIQLDTQVDIKLDIQ